ncbi:MAG: multidrug DMT transporter permease [Gammaproteobacteria bacterium TMED78]|nr:MAG: multidrug DMT transporter permease [Gammaproteobacteria bacterium TMED78]
MFIIQDYTIAVIFCVITMFCWGSWANTQKLAGKEWRFELFYWDYVLGVLLASILFAFTIGSAGNEGRGFIEDLAQASSSSLISAIIGGVIFNLANILLVAAIALAGMAVAFPVGIGLALVIGVVVNYIAQPQGDPLLLFIGVGLVALAIILDAMVYKRLPGQGGSRGTLGLGLAILCGILMGFFYRFVAAAMAPNFEAMEPGLLSPYTAMVFFALGIFLSNFILNTIIMLKPFQGEPISPIKYFRGRGIDHFWGIAGGMIWSIGMMFSIIAFGIAGAAISYGLGQGATMVAALWGVFVWKEFKEAPKGTNKLIVMMFISFIVGLALIVRAGL